MTNLDDTFFEYFEERRLGASSGLRRRNVSIEPSVVHPRPASVSYGMYRTRQLESNLDADPSQGVWPINYLRVQKYWGIPDRETSPDDSIESDWPPNVDELAGSRRVHHYHRIRDVATARNLVEGGGIAIAIEVSSDWYDPKEGRIPHPYTDELIRGIHSVALADFENDTRSFVFHNSWGENWGLGGVGLLHESLFNHVVAAWRMVGVGYDCDLDTETGLVALLWKCKRPDGVAIYGREIVNAATLERLAWAFMVRSGNCLDIEEFFVWPTARGRGIGRTLAMLVQELARQSRKQLRAWIPFADSEMRNRTNLHAFLRMMNMELHPSPVRWAGYLANRQKALIEAPEPVLPTRPSATRNTLLFHRYRSEPQASSFGNDTLKEQPPRVYRVWFGTNRKLKDVTRPSDGYSNERDNSIHLGYCDVVVPKTHRFGSTGTPWWNRLLLSTDDRLWVKGRVTVSADVYWQHLRSAFIRLKMERPDCLIYIHGYNVTFDAAAIRAAQIGFDLKIPITAFFSWASRGTPLGYSADEATIEFSESHIAQFLSDFVANTNAERIHILAHSMGNRGLVRALHTIIQQLPWSDGRRISQIILAAPDIDAGVFRQLSSVYGPVALRTTLYASPQDRAIALSQMLHTYHRAGLSPPVTVVPSIDTIVVPGFDVFNLLGHSYYAEAESILYDIFDLIQRNASPADRLRLAQKDVAGQIYWELGR
jgi:esterase/lipase superfamily enzyme/GNAT superfamily N-acetyltransferase